MAQFTCLKVDGILAVHEFHVWQLAGKRIIASAHILCRNPDEYIFVAEKVKNFFHNAGIHSTTIQAEFKGVSISYEMLKFGKKSTTLWSGPKT